MAKQKYSHNIITRPRQKDIEQWKEFGDHWKVNVYVDGDIVKGGYYLEGTWWYKASDIPEPNETHTHDFDEYLGFIGTNPDDPFDLGGEMELWMDGEKYTLTETSMVFIPAGVSHCPVYCRRVDRPIWFFATTHETKYNRDIKVKKINPKGT
jgi:hypothetical protein